MPQPGPLSWLPSRPSLPSGLPTDFRVSTLRPAGKNSAPFQNTRNENLGKRAKEEATGSHLVKADTALRIQSCTMKRLQMLACGALLLPRLSTSSICREQQIQTACLGCRFHSQGAGPSVALPAWACLGACYMTRTSRFQTMWCE